MGFISLVFINERDLCRRRWVICLRVSNCHFLASESEGSLLWVFSFRTIERENLNKCVKTKLDFREREMGTVSVWTSTCMCCASLRCWRLLLHGMVKTLKIKNEICREEFWFWSPLSVAFETRTISFSFLHLEPNLCVFFFISFYIKIKCCILKMFFKK